MSSALLRGAARAVEGRKARALFVYVLRYLFEMIHSRAKWTLGGGGLAVPARGTNDNGRRRPTNDGQPKTYFPYSSDSRYNIRSVRI